MSMDRAGSDGEAPVDGSGPDAAPPDEEALLASLGNAVRRADPSPPEVRAAAIAAYAARDLDAELARLDYDSLLDEDALAGVRASAGGPRLVTFVCERATVEVEVTVAGRLQRLLGQIVPPRRADVSVQHAGETLRTTADELGRFAVEGVRHGPVRLRCALDGPGGGHVDTDWVTL